MVPLFCLIGGKQYIAVTTGLGGCSLRQLARTILPDIHHPNGGNAVYVFELQDSNGKAASLR